MKKTMEKNTRSARSVSGGRHVFDIIPSGTPRSPEEAAKEAVERIWTAVRKQREGLNRQKELDAQA
jgi:hypothetical protein